MTCCCNAGAGPAGVGGSATGPGCGRSCNGAGGVGADTTGVSGCISCAAVVDTLSAGGGGGVLVCAGKVRSMLAVARACCSRRFGSELARRWCVASGAVGEAAFDAMTARQPRCAIAAWSECARCVTKDREAPAAKRTRARVRGTAVSIPGSDTQRSGEETGASGCGGVEHGWQKHNRACSASSSPIRRTCVSFSAINFKTNPHTATRIMFIKFSRSVLQSKANISSWNRGSIFEATYATNSESAHLPSGATEDRTSSSALRRRCIIWVSSRLQPRQHA